MWKFFAVNELMQHDEFLRSNVYTSALRKTPSLLRFIHTLYVYQALELVHKEQPNHNYNCVALGDAIVVTTAVAAVCRFLFLFVLSIFVVFEWQLRLLFHSASLLMCGDFSRGLCVCGVCLFDDNNAPNQKTTAPTTTINIHFCSLPAFLHFVIMFLNVCCFLFAARRYCVLMPLFTNSL